MHLDGKPRLVQNLLGEGRRWAYQTHILYAASDPSGPPASCIHCPENLLIACLGRIGPLPLPVTVLLDQPVPCLEFLGLLAISVLAWHTQPWGLGWGPISIGRSWIVHSGNAGVLTPCGVKFDRGKQETGWKWPDKSLYFFSISHMTLRHGFSF